MFLHQEGLICKGLKKKFDFSSTQFFFMGICICECNGGKGGGSGLTSVMVQILSDLNLDTLGSVYIDFEKENYFSTFSEFFSSIFHLRSRKFSEKSAKILVRS